MSRFCLAVVLAAALSAPAAAEPLRIVSESRGSVIFELVLSAPVLSPLDTAAAGKRCRVYLREFDTMDIPGTPILPVRRFSFAVTARDGVRLEILDQETAAIEGVLPVVALEKWSVEEERAALERVPGIEEQRFVTLAGIETVRRRSVAFVDVRPVLYDPAGRRLVHLTRLTARLVFLRRRGLPFLPVADAAALGIPLGLAFGRIGCALAGCCYGKPTALSWGIVFSDPACLAPLHVPLHPTQLYESLAGFAIFGILSATRDRFVTPGMRFWTMLILYGAARSLLELLRDDPRGFVGPFSESQVVSAVLVAYAVISIVRTRARLRGRSGLPAAP